MTFRYVVYELSILIFFLTPGLLQAPPPQVRDGSREGSAQKLAVITGRVTAADGGAGLAKARVTLRSLDSQPGEQPLTVKTNENGDYQLNQVKPGKYLLSAGRNGYVWQNYGQKTADMMFDPGTPVTVRPGETLSQIDFKLIRGGVVEGRVFDQDNEPMPNVEVQLARYRTVQGKRTLMPAGMGQTDDRGHYRIFDLPPGSYYVSASSHGFGRFFVAQEGAQPTYPPTYYPGVLTPEEASKVQVSAGAEVNGVDMALMEVSSYSISGRVLTSDGKPAHSAYVMPVRIPLELPRVYGPGSGTDLQGNFKMPNLLPGKYRLMAHLLEEGKQQSASTVVELGEEDVSGVSLVLGDGAEVSGRILLDGPKQKLDPRQVRVDLIPEGGFELRMFGGGSAEAKEDFTFHQTNIAEGLYRFQVTLPPGNSYVKSIRVEGREGVDQPLEVRGNDRISGVEVIVSSEGAQLDGLVRKEENGETLPGATVILFSTNPEQRGSNSRFTKSAQADQEGHFSIKGIVPGEYAVCALSRHEPGAEENASFLKEIETAAKQVKLSAHQTHTESLVAIAAPAAE
jgi:uncharacterized surface anchored protein